MPRSVIEKGLTDWHEDLGLEFLAYLKFHP